MQKKESAKRKKNNFSVSSSNLKKGGFFSFFFSFRRTYICQRSLVLSNKITVYAIKQYGHILLTLVLLTLSKN